MERLAVALIFFLVFSGCQAKSSFLRSPLENEGEVYLYLDPFPQSAAALSFRLRELSAVKEDGSIFPLSLKLEEFDGAALKRQRLIASGQLPAGMYSGFLFRVESARLAAEEGNADLLIPEEPSKTDFSFSVGKKKAHLLALSFQYAESLKSGASFRPVFRFSMPEKPLPSLTGYLSNSFGNTIMVFDRKKHQVADVIAAGAGPAGITLDRLLRRAYVALSGDDAIGVIDVASGDMIHRIVINRGDRPQELVLTPDGLTLLTANEGSNTVSIIDTASLIETARVRVGDSPSSLLTDSTGRKAYVFNTRSNTLSVLDIGRREVVATVSTDAGPLRGELSSRGNRLYVIHEGSPYLLVFDTQSLAVVKREMVGSGMASIAVDPRTDLIYLGRRNEPDVAVYEPLTFIPVGTVRTGGTAAHMHIDSTENNLYLVIPEEEKLMVVNLVSRKTVAEMDTGGDPSRVAAAGQGRERF